VESAAAFRTKRSNRGEDKLEKVKREEKMMTRGNSEPETRWVNIRPLKMFASKNLPADSVLRAALLEEKETLEKREFLAKMDVWLSLLRLSFKSQPPLAVSNWVRGPSGNSIPFPNGGCDSLET
jgi:hypothetical protein